MKTRTVEKIIRSALKEDIGKLDITTAFSIPASSKGEAVIFARQSGILCGVEVAAKVFEFLPGEIRFKPLKRDGSSFRKEEKIALVRGNMRNILSGERVCLNFLSLLSGISTFTAKFVKEAAGKKVKIMDTRKTTPNLRALEKYAVRVGGGCNHRSSLSDGIIIKDNHLKAGRYIVDGEVNKKELIKLISNLKQKFRHAVVVEVENLDEFRSVIQCSPKVIMLDNFSLSNLKKAVGLRNRHYPEIKLEASGGIKLSNIKSVCATGIDSVSLGALTHSPSAVDFSLEIL
ncbi:MAG: carboxylating nicotinate-nucleotide diphosphorylase [Candidatus Omnitrophica bacterium]|nr:carboxylating nicotinate-nucleotide diphosphorylase [Candidatus Omnitrophota bacterium]MBD3269649.1 carboxylating nicotinate-nucleotide diphosphorylase [Candidatus Omnitrophota bacterium]